MLLKLQEKGEKGGELGTIFTVSDHESVLKHSTNMILDPLLYHPADKKIIDSQDLRETVKELSQLDGAFIVSDEGIFISACRYINSSSTGVSLPLGLGSRHMAAASISRQTNAIAVVVSESAVVRVFDNGEIVSEIIPEIWLLTKYGVHLNGAYSTRTGGGLTAISKEKATK